MRTGRLQVTEARSAWSWQTSLSADLSYQMDWAMTSTLDTDTDGPGKGEREKERREESAWDNLHAQVCSPGHTARK